MLPWIKGTTKYFPKSMVNQIEEILVKFSLLLRDIDQEQSAQDLSKLTRNPEAMQKEFNVCKTI